MIEDMSGSISLFFTAVAAVAAAISAILSAVQARRTRIVQEKIEQRTKVASTITAFNDLQEQVLDKMVSYKDEDIKILIEDIDEEEVREAYDACRALIARCEHFTVGVNCGVYDFDTTYKLGGTHLIYLYQKFLPIIENVRNDSNSDLPYAEFERLYQNLFEKYCEK